MKRPVLLYSIILVTAFLLMQGCETWRSECGGEIVVENPISDTTLYVGEEPLFRDLFASPVVLRHTEGKSIVISVLADDGTIVEGTPARSPTTGRLNAIEVTPLKEGTTKVRIIAEDGCEELEINFNVTVIDTTQQGN